MPQNNSLNSHSKAIEIPQYGEDEKGLPKELITLNPIYMHHNSGSNKNTLRVYPDGSIWRYSNTKRDMTGEFPKRVDAEWAWRSEGSVNEPGLLKLKTLLDGPFRNLKSKEISTGDRDRGHHFRCAIYDNSYYEVVLPAGPIPANYEVIQDIDNAIFHNLVVHDEE